MDAARPTHTVLTSGRMWRMVSNTAMPAHASACQDPKTPLFSLPKYHFHPAAVASCTHPQRTPRAGWESGMTPLCNLK